jgi:hypothetical protein
MMKIGETILRVSFGQASGGFVKKLIHDAYATRVRAYPSSDSGLLG